MEQVQKNISAKTENAGISHKGKKLSYYGTVIVALIYGAVLLKLVLFKYGLTTDMRGLNLIPFQSIIDFFIADISVSVLAKNVLGNIAIFLPLGMLLPMLFHKLTFKNTILLGFGTSLLFEVLQYTVGLGIGDVDDLILNTLGTIIGGVLYFYGMRKLDQKFYNQFASLFCVGAVGIGLFLTMNFFGYQANLGSTPSVVVNIEVMHGLDVHNPDAGFTSATLEGDVVQGSVTTSENEALVVKQVSYQVTEKTHYVIEHRSCEYSVNGNVTKVITTYEEIEKQQFADLSKETSWMDVWLDENGAVDTATILVFEQ